MKENILKEIAIGLEHLKSLVGRGVIEKEELEKKFKESDGELELTGDDWIYAGGKSVYPSETASLALTARNSDNNIEATGIAALYSGFPIIVANTNGAYIWRTGKLLPVVGVNRRFVDSPVVLRGHIFGQKNTDHWVWMNSIIGQLCRLNIRTDNNTGPYFLTRDFFYYLKESSKGIVISPMKAVIAEPYLNKQKEEISAFLIQALNKQLPEAQRFFISDMSGNSLFLDGKIKKVESPLCPIYCASGWIAGPTKELVFNVLRQMKGIAEKIKPEKTNEKIEKLLKDLQQFEG